MSTYTEVVEDAPLWVFLKGLLYPVVNYQVKYEDSETINYAAGELVRFKMKRPGSTMVGRRFLGDGHDEKGEFDTIHVYLGGGWFKLISKTY